MSIRNINKMLTAVAVVMIAIVALSCVRSNDQGGTIRNDLPLEKLRDGDLLFRCGTSTQSHMVMNLDSASSNYSHVGIAIKHGGKWCVVHAVPGESSDGVDRVKVDAVDTFFMTSRAEHGAAMRMGCNATSAHQAALSALQLAQRGVKFDNNYNWSDSTSLYCTEMVQVAYQSAGIDLAQGRKTHIALPFYQGDIVFPSDLLRNQSLHAVFSF